MEIATLGLEGRVKLLGNCRDVQRYLAAADIGCLLSVGEAFPLTVIEYMAVGLPVIASQRPPFDELVHPAWGMPVSEFDASAVAAAISGLLRSPDLRQRMGQAGRDQALAKHQWRRVAPQYEDVMLVALGAR
jgi:glycosyltransferase involved in cell wall biosynthesis